jgi:hypothetical protein
MSTSPPTRSRDCSPDDAGRVPKPSGATSAAAGCTRRSSDPLTWSVKPRSLDYCPRYRVCPSYKKHFTRCNTANYRFCPGSARTSSAPSKPNVLDVREQMHALLKSLGLITSDYLPLDLSAVSEHECFH